MSILQEESLQQIVSGICDPHAILQNLSEQDICFDGKDPIIRERNAVELYDQRDSKGLISFISFKEGCPKDHLQCARNVLNQLLVKFPANTVAPCRKSGTLGTEHLYRCPCKCTCYLQFSNFIGMQSSFRIGLPLTIVLW